MVPPVYPITDAIIIIGVYTLFSVIYAFYIKYKKPDVARRAGKTVNLVDEEHNKI